MKTARPTALFLTFITGFAALVYEVVWQRYLANLLGSHARATSLILAVFLGGLSVGYFIFGKMSAHKRARALVGICGIVESVIGIWALFFPRLYDLAWNLRTHGSPSLSFASDLLLAIALIGVPTAAMGGTLPLLTQGLSRDLSDSSSFHARVYSINTAGAFLGCLVAGFVLLPLFGLPLTIAGTSLLNIGAGVGLLLLSRSLNGEAPNDSAAHEVEDIGTDKSGISIRRASAIAFLAGAYSLALQTILIRMVGLAVGSSEYAFSMIVSVFIFMLALGAARVSTKTQRAHSLWRNQVYVVAGTLVIYGVIPAWPYSAHLVRTIFSTTTPSFYVYYATLFVLLGVVTALAVGAMGSTMPLLFREVSNRFSEIGKHVGVLYAWNTVGCVFGALVGGHVALYWINLDTVLQAALCLMLCALLLSMERTRKRRYAVVTMLTMALIVVALPAWPKQYFAKGTFRHLGELDFSYSGIHEFYRHFFGNARLLAYKDDPNTSVAVIETPWSAGPKTAHSDIPARSIWVNGKSDGSTAGGDLFTTRLLAHLPALFQHAKSTRAAVVGFGTGITVGSLSLHPSITTIDCIEISPAVRAFAPLFDYANHQVSKSAKINWVINDAYRALPASNAQYAVIVSEPSNPWMTGVERLYAQEFYQLVQRKLAPGGVYAQWFHTYSLSEETLRMVLRTFSSVFPEVRIFYTGFDLILLGSADPIVVNLDSLSKAFAVEPIKAELEELGITSPFALASFQMYLPVAALGSAHIHTLDVPRLSYAAGKDFYRNSKVSLTSLTTMPRLRPWASTFVDESLYSQLSAAEPRPISAALRELCRQNVETIPEAWTEKSFQCRAVVARALIDGFFESTDIRWQKLRTLLSNPTALSVHESEDAFALLAEFPPYEPPSAALLSKTASQCSEENNTEALECYGRYVQALAALGYGKDALGAFTALNKRAQGSGLNLTNLGHEVRAAVLASEP